MDLEVLVATMHQKDYGLLEKMNIDSKVIIGNQSNYNSIEEIMYKGNRAIYYSFDERGVGLNRNNTFMRSTEDICLFADDDVVYVDNYRNLILGEFNKHKEADVILFNFHTLSEERPETHNSKFRRIHSWECVNYCTYRIAVRTDNVRKKNIMFSLLFGGGARYGSGEDCIFLRDCIKKGLKVYASPVFIGKVDHKESTWFSGYNEKLFFDKGALFTYVSKFFSRIYFLGFLYFLKQSDKKIFEGEIGFIKAYKLMVSGGKNFLSRF